MGDTYNAVLKEIVDETPTVKCFHLTFDRLLDHSTGQFIQVILNKEGKEIKKSYSIASLPGDPFVELCINKVPGGFASTLFHEMKTGQELTFEGPYGHFTPDYSHTGEWVFIATGTGIAPLRAMIKDVLARGIEQKIYLIFGNRYEEDIIYKKEFEDLAAKHKNFLPFFIVSRNKEWQGLKGHVQEHLKDILKKPEGKIAYLCGLPAMVLDTRKVLLEWGFDRKMIKQELYT